MASLFAERGDPSFGDDVYDRDEGQIAMPHDEEVYEYDSYDEEEDLEDENTRNSNSPSAISEDQRYIEGKRMAEMTYSASCGRAGTERSRNKEEPVIPGLVQQQFSIAATESTASSSTLQSEPDQVDPSTTCGKFFDEMYARANKEKSGGKRRLASDLYRIMRQNTQELGFKLEPKDEDSMDRWTIQLFNFPQQSHLHRDLCKIEKNFVELEMTFPDQYPFEPPFVRVVRPRFRPMSGFIIGGAICMELLSKEGWNPVNDIESVIISIRSMMLLGNARVAAVSDREEKASLKNKSEKKLQSFLSKMFKTRANDRKSSTAQGNPDGEEKKGLDEEKSSTGVLPIDGGTYRMSETKRAHNHIYKYHKRKGWDQNGRWEKIG